MNYPFVGIVEKCDSEAFRFRDDPSCVLGYFYGGWGHIGRCKGGKHKETLLEGAAKWGKDETIKVKVDCQNWQLTFFKNEKVLGKPVGIKERDAYYAAVEMFGMTVLQIRD